MSFELVAPSDPEEAVRLLREFPPGGSAVLAGGTDLLLDIEEGRVRPQRVVSLRNLPWRSRAWADGALRIGSTLPLSELEADPRLRSELPGLWKAIHAVGSLALRHRATVGGNLGRSAPASDLLPVLLALRAEVLLFGPAGSRRLDLDQFLEASRRTALREGELVEAVDVRTPQPSEYLWQRVRPANDISQVGVAVAYAPPEGRWHVAVGGVIPRPLRLLEAESELSSERPTDSEIERAAERAATTSPFVSDKRATEVYRRHLVRVLVGRALRVLRSSVPAGRAT